MRTILLTLAATFTPLLCFAGEPTPAESRDPKATTMHLDKLGNAVSVAREGRTIHLMTREATPDVTDPKGVVVLYSDGGVRLTRRQALRLTELLDDAIRDIDQASGRKDSGESAGKAPWLHLVAAPGMICDGNTCRMAAPAKRVTGRSKPTACGDCNSCGPSSANYAPRRAFRSRGRFFGRIFGRRCCR